MGKKGGIFSKAYRHGTGTGVTDYGFGSYVAILFVEFYDRLLIICEAVGLYEVDAYAAEAAAGESCTEGPGEGMRYFNEFIQLRGGIFEIDAAAFV